jgi:hypothetical protein
VILFLAANPRDTGRLALDREARAIHLELKRSGHRDRFEFVARWAAEPLDLLRELRELKPTIVHFSGHGARPAGPPDREQGRDVVPAGPSRGEPSAVVFDSANGRSQLVTPEAIASTLGAVDARARLVVLNACFTEPMAEALLVHVDCVVGMSGAIHDDAARSFAVGFYGGLGEHNPFRGPSSKAESPSTSTGSGTPSIPSSRYVMDSMRCSSSWRPWRPPSAWICSVHTRGCGRTWPMMRLASTVATSRSTSC